MKQELKEIGLAENEIKVYITLLKSGELTSYMLSKQTSINRGYLYELLKRLNEKGIISEINKDGKSHYKATDPEQLSSIMEFKLESLKKIVPELAKTKNTWTEETKIDVYKGSHCFKIVMNSIISNSKPASEVLIFGTDEKLLLDLEPNYLKRYFSIITKKNIKERIIVKDGTKIIKEAKTTSYKFLPASYIGRIVQIIYGNKVALLTLSEPLNLVIISDKDIVSTYTKQFELFWKVAKKK